MRMNINLVILVIIIIRNNCYCLMLQLYLFSMLFLKAISITLHRKIFHNYLNIEHTNSELIATENVLCV